MADNITAEEYKKALEERRVVLVGTNDRGTYYDLYIIKNNELIPVRGIGSYWSKEKNCYWVTAQGTSRPLEIILSVGYALGLSFRDIKQRYIVL